MTAAYQELQHAFTHMDDRFYDFRCRCRELAQSLREDLAEYLGISPADVKFFRSDELDEINLRGQAEFPQQYNDPFEAGELASGGSYRIGLSFGITPIGENVAAWYPLVPLQLTSNGEKFSLTIERSGIPFDLEHIPERNLRKISHWIVERWNEIARGGFENFILGKRNEMGFHAIFREYRNKK
jgi:hypothetical protein